MSRSKQILIIPTLICIGYLIFSITLFEFMYWRNTYFEDYYSFFASDLINYTIYALLLFILMIVLGYKLTWKTVLVSLLVQLITSIIFIIGIFVVFNGRNYDIELNQVNHGDFFFWIDYRIGYNRWYETRLSELGILAVFLILLKFIPSRKWGILVKTKKNEATTPLDEISEN